MKKSFKLLITITMALNSSCGARILLSDCYSNEKSAIPVGHVLVILAHQDDEVFIASRLRTHALNGDSIFIVWTSLLYQNGRDYCERRRQESLEAIRQIGVDSSRCIFFGYPDGRTYDYMDTIVYLVTAAINRIQPKTIYTTAYEGGHIDHDVANFAAAESIRQLNYQCNFIEFPLYSAYKSGMLPFIMRSYPESINTCTRELTAAEYEFVKKMWSKYHSQHFPLGWYITITPGSRTTFGFEYVRSVPKYNYLIRPSNGRAAYESFLSADFDDFTKAVVDYYRR